MNYNPGSGIYVASKVKFAHVWRAYKEAGFPINSSWIDMDSTGDPDFFLTLWDLCIEQASTCAALVLYAPDDSVLKGALVEVGAALAQNKPVIVVGDSDGLKSVKHHRNIRVLTDLDEAMYLAKTYCS